jgi:ribonuclease J
MNITIHRGIDQIGGCITEIESKNGTKILIDLGHNLPEGDKPSKDKYDNPEQLAKLLKGVNAVFYTHSHGDHIGFESQVHAKKIPQYVGTLAKDLLITHREHMMYVKDIGMKKNAEDSLEAILDFHTYSAKKTEKIGGGDIKVTPFFVSHSAADAYMLLVECDDKVVLHTGDYRSHGLRGGALFDMIKKYIVSRKQVDVLITEGTMLGRDDKRMIPEAEIETIATKWIGDYRYVFVLCSSMDADRLSSLFRANRANGKHRPFIVDFYQKQVLDVIRKHIGQGTRTYYKFGGLISRFDDKTYHSNLLKLIKENGFLMLVRNSEKYNEWLREIGNVVNLNDALFIYSQFSGYINQDHKAFSESTYNFVHRYDWKIEQLHTSGHASKETLAAVCETVNPRYAIIPIHRDAKSDFCSLNISQELKDKVITEADKSSKGEIMITIKQS